MRRQLASVESRLSASEKAKNALQQKTQQIQVQCVILCLHVSNWILGLLNFMCVCVVCVCMSVNVCVHWKERKKEHGRNICQVMHFCSNTIETGC